MRNRMPMTTLLHPHKKRTGSYRILVVDDDELIIESFERVFKEYESNFEINKTTDGKEAIRLIEEREYDLIITDIVMPDVDGIQILRKVKQVQPDSEVILITAYSSTGSALDAMHFGAFDYITKPFDLAELKVRIMRAINKRKTILEKKKKIDEIERLCYTISHDFKSTLISIKGFTKILTHDYYTKLDGEGQFLINRINANITTMESMVEGLLEYTKIGSWQIEKENINSGDIIREVAANFTPSLKGHTINMIIKKGLPEVYFYRNGLRLVFTNLIDNAIKYSSGGTNSYIKIGIDENAPPDNHFHHFYVEDNGTGIGEENLERIFEIFQRGTLGTREHGYGIGLAIVRKILTTMHCTIRAESEEGKPTRFTFTLPKAVKISPRP
jgi:signal transduction histidine kinase